MKSLDFHPLNDLTPHALSMIKTMRKIEFFATDEFKENIATRKSSSKDRSTYNIYKIPQNYKIPVQKANAVSDRSESIFSTAAKRSKTLNRSRSLPTDADANTSLTAEQIVLKIKEESLYSVSQQAATTISASQDLLDSNSSQIDDNYLSQMTQEIRESPRNDDFGKRMTRLFFRNEIDTVSTLLLEIIKTFGLKTISFENKNIRIVKTLQDQLETKFNLMLLNMTNNVVMCEFRRISGCGIEFKKSFLDIRNTVKEICRCQGG